MEIDKCRSPMVDLSDFVYHGKVMCRYKRSDPCVMHVTALGERVSSCRLTAFLLATGFLSITAVFTGTFKVVDRCI
jgi:hypothetical protein